MAIDMRDPWEILRYILCNTTRQMNKRANKLEPGGVEGSEKKILFYIFRLVNLCVLAALQTLTTSYAVCSGYLDLRRVLSTMWPWNIKPALVVLWGVCWMFVYQGCLPHFGYGSDISRKYSLVELLRLY